jgi:hypothetical protein
LHTAVIDVAADPDPNAADESRVVGEGHDDAFAEAPEQFRFDHRARAVGEGHRAFDLRAVLLVIQPQQPLKPCQHGESAWPAGVDDPLDDFTGTILIEDAVHEAQLEHLTRLTLRLPFGLHRRSVD